MSRDNGQQALIDTDHPRKAEVLKLAGKIKDLDKKRAEAQTKGAELRQEMIDLLKAMGVTHFVGGDYEIDVKDPEIKVSIKVRKEDNEA